MTLTRRHLVQGSAAMALLPGFIARAARAQALETTRVIIGFAP